MLLVRHEAYKHFNQAKISTTMKKIIFTLILSAGMAGAYAQTNNNGGAGTPTNPTNPSTITPNDGTPNNGTPNNGTVTPKNNNGTEFNNGAQKNSTSPGDTATLYNNNKMSPSDKKNKTNPSQTPPVIK